MQYVYRTVGLIRGKHAYGIMADDLKKDDAIHSYQWTAMLNGGVWQANYQGLSANELVLGFGKDDGKIPTLPDYCNLNQEIHYYWFMR